MNIFVFMSCIIILSVLKVKNFLKPTLDLDLDIAAFSVYSVLMKEHLEQRGVTFHRYFADEETATFLLYNPHGKLVGYQVYRPSGGKDKKNHPREGRYYTYVPKEVDGFFGLEYDVGALSS